jgi:hypothetical protein
MLEDSQDLLQNEDADFRNYKRAVNQIDTFEYCLKTAPEIQNIFMNQVLQGNTSYLQELITTYSITIQDILQMRSLDFIVPVDIEDPKYASTDMRLNMDAYNWNPIHFATAYKRYKVLDLFKRLFAHKMDLLWAMSLPFQDNYEGVLLETNRFKHGLNQFLDEENAHLYGYILVLTTKSVDLLEFFITQLTEQGGLILKEVKYLIEVCKTLKWEEGVLCLIKSTFAKNLFVLAPMKDKVELVEMLMGMRFVEAFMQGEVEL